jgi:hypothetical protein
MFRKQESAIRDLQEKQRSLKTFLDTLTNASCFDGDDRVVVVNKLSAVSQELKTQEETLERNKAIYVSKVQQVEQTLKKREDVLKQCDSIFRLHPDLLQFFSEKQRKCSEEMRSITKQLENA